MQRLRPNAFGSTKLVAELFSRMQTWLLLLHLILEISTMLCTLVGQVLRNSRKGCPRLDAILQLKCANICEEMEMKMKQLLCKTILTCNCNVNGKWVCLHFVRDGRNMSQERKANLRLATPKKLDQKWQPCKNAVIRNILPLRIFVLFANRRKVPMYIPLLLQRWLHLILIPVTLSKEMRNSTLTYNFSL